MASSSDFNTECTNNYAYPAKAVKYSGKQFAL